MPSHRNLLTLIESQAARHPQRIAAFHNAQTLSYQALNERANRIAHYLIASGQTQGGCVGLCFERSFDLLTAILGVLKAGAAYVPFDVEYPAERLQRMARLSGIPLMLSTAAVGQRLPQGDFQTIDIQQIGEETNCTNPGLYLAETQAAYVLFTSGSTGEPKGVELPHRALLNLIDWQLTQTSVHDEGRTLQFSPISFDVHFQEIFSTWCDGGSLVLINDELRLNAEALLKHIDQYQVNRIFLPFIALQSLCEFSQHAKADLASLREVITAGEQLQVTPALVDFFERIPHCRLINHYGPTETHVVTSYRLEGPPASWPKLPPIGKPINHCEIYLLDENGQPVKDGLEGELFAAGRCLANGYLNREELTAERFLPNPFRPGERMYKTGDLAVRTADGNLQYLGRIDGQVKVRGYRIELGEVEVALSRFRHVKLCAATVREDRPGEKKLVAYLVMDAGETFNVQEIRAFLQQQIPDYMLPSAFVEMPSLPRTPSGKIDRNSLPPPANKRPELGVVYRSPASEPEKRLCSLWSEILHIDPVGINDNFFDLGGNSLLALQTVALLKTRHDTDISVIKVYMHPTPAALTASIDGSSAENNFRDIAQARAQARHRQAGNSTDDSIAVIGISLRFPGADSVEAFWNNLCAGEESVTFFRPDELDPSLPADLVSDPNYVAARGIINDAKGFDAAFFNMNPNVALVTDPQQRVGLELAWNALEHAGYSPDHAKGLIGVFAGVGNNSYYLNNVLPNEAAIQRVGSFLAMTQNEKDYIATRIAYELNLKGLAISVHTGCSTSLTAIVMAADALLNHQCDLALAGGAAITAPIHSGQRYEEGAIYSNDGHTRSFDAEARGTVFSDGAGFVVLKRTAEALADGDTVYALIKGGALNNDGGDKGSFTAPSVEGQAAVISMAQAMAGVDASSISYVETHGTATPVGDPIEIEGLTQAFQQPADSEPYCAIGSVKSNLGHLTAAAGIAGFIKTTLALHHQTLPASLFFSKANPQIRFAETPFFVNDQLRAWDTPLLPRRAGVSSFGVGGTNAHVVLEEAPPITPSVSTHRTHLIQLSARTPSALESRRSELLSTLKQHPEISLADACFTLQCGRQDFPFRWFASVHSVADALIQLENSDGKRSAKNHLTQHADGIVFMFPGQGSQYVGMGSTLYRDESVFRTAVDRCCDFLQPLLGRDLRELMFAEEGNIDAQRLLKQTYYTQPALFTLGYSLAQLWMGWGIQPTALIGHSIGEFVAATLAGVFSLEDGLSIVASRCKLMQACPGGAMLSVRLPESAVAPLLNDRVAIAAVNGPQLCVVSGPNAEIDALQQAWEAQGVICKPLHTSHAFHSPMMDTVIEPFAAAIQKLSLHPPSIPILSTVTKQWLKDSEATDPMYWAGHLRATVRFAEGVKAVWSELPRHLMLELGPRNTATLLARQQSIDAKSQKAIPSLGDSAENESEWTCLLSAVGQLWLNGIGINHQAFYSAEKRRRIALPGYPFEHKTYWLDPPQNSAAGTYLLQDAQHTPFTTSTAELPIMAQRKERLINEITEVLEESSGMELKGSERDADFVELGLDSLLLTQVALTLSKKYGLKVSFRQLNEDLSTLNSLADYFDQNLRPEAGGVATAQAAANSPEGSMQWLIEQQLQIMQQQLRMVAGQTPQAVISAATQPIHVNTSLSSDEEKELKKPFGAVARIEKSSSGQFTEAQQCWLSDFTQRYNDKTKASKAYTQNHRAHLADPRVVTGFRPHLKELIYQPVVNRSLGSKLWDIDGNEYVDILNGFGSNLFGHNPPFIVEAISEQLKKGYELGPQHELAGEVAAMICAMTGFDRAGFCNTGSEAVLGAMRVARTVTGRSTIISFNNSYHGINDEVIVRGSKKLKPIPAAAGILPEAVHNMLVIDYGTPESLEVIRQHAHSVAAVLVEPIQSRRADFQPAEFLREVRKITTACGCLLIFDEMITGFRLLPGGAQQYYGIKADLGTYGKVVGGGMPIGVIAGKAEYMDALDGGFWQFGDNSVPEVGVTYFAGTFVRHPFALAAAKAALTHMKNEGPRLQEELNAKTEVLTSAINAFCDSLGLPFSLVRFGSLFKPKYAAELPNADLLYPLLRYKGVHLYDGFPCFLTEAHSREDIEFVAKAFKDSLQELVQLGFLPGRTAVSLDPDAPPVPGARRGKNPDGTQSWFIADPDRPGKYLKLKTDQTE
ncbi:MAG: amino acid adenylation domain-containing protein [Betaproteobacteria bacterium]